MKQPLLRYHKLSVIILGCFLFCNSSHAQINYWTAAGDTNPLSYGYGASDMVFNNGNLYVSFNDYPTPYFAIWNGSTWQTYALPDTFDAAENFNSDMVNAVCADNYGNVYMAGTFNDTSGGFVIEWNGNSWIKVGEGADALHANNDITALCIGANGYLYAGGFFTDAQGHQYVARWDGTAWSAVGPSTNLAIASDQNPGSSIVEFDGYLYTRGNVDWQGLSGWGVFVYDGSTWSNIDPSVLMGNLGNSCVAPNGNIYINEVVALTMWNGSSLVDIDGGGDNLSEICMDAAGNLYAAGYIGSIGQTCVAKWTGTAWQELGTNNFALNANGNIDNICPGAASTIYATGDFTNSAGYDYVAEYIPLPPGQLAVYLQATGANCSNNGAITSTIYQGTPPYIYAWSNGSTSPNPGSLVSGQYYVTVTDAMGAIALGDIYVPGACNTIISGTVFVDSSGTCIYNGLQPGIQGVILTLSGGSQTLYATTDANGNYSFDVNDTGNYYLYIQVGNNSLCGNFTLCGNPSQTINVGVIGDSSNGNNFALNPSSSSFDLYLHPGWTSASRGFEKDYWIDFANNSPVPFTGAATVAFKYDSNLIFLSSDTPYTTYNAAADSITWVVNNFNNTGWNYVGRVRFQVPSTLPLNYQLQSHFWIYPYMGDCDTSNNYLHYSETVVGSHDPNYKEVSPLGEIDEDDSILTYTIHYQNTGTDSTHFIIVSDALSSYLNPASVRNLASSDNYSSFNVSGSGILTWTFCPLSLPSSTIDSMGSKGFITFSVKKNSNVPNGQRISNSATIYFDYNEGITTNTVTDSIFGPCTINYDTINAQTCSNVPYPFNGQSYDTAGSYNDTLTNVGGCDSIVTLNLTVIFPTILIMNTGVCLGDSIVVDGHAYYTQGSYKDTLIGHNGCDSIVLLNLSVFTLPADTVAQSVCSGDTLSWNGGAYTTAGFYTDTLHNAHGCDSIVTLQLTIKPVPVVTLSWDSMVAKSLLSICVDLCQGPDTGIFTGCGVNIPYRPLSGGYPAGGTYTGYGVLNDTIFVSMLSNTVYADTVYYTYTDTNGCIGVAEDSLFIHFCTAINDLSINNQISIYPNPANTTLFIKVTGVLPETMKLYTVTGQLVYEGKFEPEIDVSNLSAGAYFIEVKAGPNSFRGEQEGRRMFVKM